MYGSTHLNNSKPQLNYIFINKRWINNALNWDANSFFEGVFPNHRIVSAKIYPSLCRNKTPTVKASQYDWSSLTKSDIRNQYMVTVKISLILFWRLLKHIHKMTNMKTLLPPIKKRGCLRDVMVKAMDYGIVVREFVVQSHYYVHFRANTLGKGMNPLILPAMG